MQFLLYALLCVNFICVSSVLSCWGEMYWKQYILKELTNGNLACIKVYIERYGSDVITWRGVGDRGKSLVLNEAELGKIDIVRALGDAGADLNAPDQLGNTVLHYLCQAGYIQFVAELVSSRKVEMFVLNKEGRTPLSYLKQDMQEEILELLTPKRKGSKSKDCSINDLQSLKFDHVGHFIDNLEPMSQLWSFLIDSGVSVSSSRDFLSKLIVKNNIYSLSALKSLCAMPAKDGMTLESLLVSLGAKELEVSLLSSKLASVTGIAETHCKGSSSSTLGSVFSKLFG